MADDVQLKAFLTDVAPRAVSTGRQRHPRIKNIIAVGSGKGGVGKSTTTVNLAVALQQAGARVGLLDADIYGPNIPHMLGLKARLTRASKTQFAPMKTEVGVECMSFGLLVEDGTPVVWRGPMISSALQQLFENTAWSELDFLFVDLPPGTGDIQLTLAKKMPVTSAVIVTTPQSVALLDARRGLEMFRKVNVGVLGVIENMSGHVCSQCGHVESLFGEGGGQELAEKEDLPLLGKIPLSVSIQTSGESGQPVVITHPEGSIAMAYRACAVNLLQQWAKLKLDYSSRMPPVVVEGRSN